MSRQGWLTGGVYGPKHVWGGTSLLIIVKVRTLGPDNELVIVNF